MTLNIAPGARHPDGERSRQSASCRGRLSGYGTIVVCQAALFICAAARAITGREHCAAGECGASRVAKGGRRPGDPALQDFLVDAAIPVARVTRPVV